MKLSTETLAVLRNFATINPNMVIQPGNVIKTIAESKTILASSKVDETFPSTVGIYDLNQFLTVHSALSDPELTFDDSGEFITLKGADDQSYTYYLSDQSILTSPTKDLNMPETEIEFTLTEEQMVAIRRASSAISATDVVIIGEEGSADVSIEVTDVKVSTANKFRMKLGTVTKRPDQSFNLIFNINNFKFLPGSFEVSVSSKLISEFVNTDTDTTYWVALEKNSTFG
jgi:hypothetical protein